jgi:hypothetical protein
MDEIIKMKKMKGEMEEIMVREKKKNSMYGVKV